MNSNEQKTINSNRNEVRSVKITIDQKQSESMIVKSNSNKIEQNQLTLIQINYRL